MADKSTKQSVSLKSGKRMNFLKNYWQNHILSPVRHDQHPETYSLDPWLTFILLPLRIGALSKDDTPQSPPGLYPLSRGRNEYSAH